MLARDRQGALPISRVRALTEHRARLGAQVLLAEVVVAAEAVVARVQGLSQQVSWEQVALAALVAPA